jgi:hypothetical protein
MGLSYCESVVCKIICKSLGGGVYLYSLLKSLTNQIEKIHSCNGCSAVCSISFCTKQSKGCSLGLRVGSGTYVVGEYFYGKDVYIDGRIGWEWANGFNLTALHMWNPKDWNWTPNLGWWFVDAGAGAFVGAGYGHVNFGVAGSAKFGILFKKVPIRLAVDVTPKIGLYAYNGGIHFWGTGLFNGGLTATYCF